MNSQYISSTVVVQGTPAQAFAAINDPRRWWGKDIEGRSDRVGDEWTYRYRDIHVSTQRVAELSPNRKVVWDVIAGCLNFGSDKTEWVGTKIVFDIIARGDATEIRFTHIGLTPRSECFEACSGAWGSLITGSLRSLIETGRGKPFELE